MTKHTRYFENYQDAYNYYGGTEVPSNEIALVGNASYVFVSSDNSYGGGNTQYFDAGMTNDTIVVTLTENAYTSGSSYGYEQGYAYGYPLGYTEGTTYGESIGYVAGQAYGEEIGYAQGYEGGYSYGYSEGVASVPVPTGNVDITTTSQYNVTSYATAQVVDANLISANIVSGTTILGVTGSYEGMVPEGTAYLQMNTLTDVSAYEFAYCEDTNGSYTAGYEGGTTYGYDWGYPIGYAEGQTYGESIGYTTGYTAGTTYGYDWGYPIGYTNGTTYGESIGYTTGYTAGYSYGYDIGYADGEDDGYAEATTPYNDQYFTLEAFDVDDKGMPGLEITNNGVDIYYSSDGGNTWTSITSGSAATIGITEGTKVMLKGTNNTLWVDDGNDAYCGLVFTGSDANFKAYGNVMSLLEGDNFGIQLNTNYSDQFHSLFIDFANLKHAKDIVLPTNGELVSYAFSEMFSGCTNLEDAPVICTAPSRAALGQATYSDMFVSCDNLKYVVVVTDQAIATESTQGEGYDVLEIGTFGSQLEGNPYLVVKSSQADNAKEAVEASGLSIIVLGYDSTEDEACYSTDAETFCLRMAANYLPKENYDEGYNAGFDYGEASVYDEMTTNGTAYITANTLTDVTAYAYAYCTAQGGGAAQVDADSSLVTYASKYIVESNAKEQWPPVQDSSGMVRGIYDCQDTSMAYFDVYYVVDMHVNIVDQLETSTNAMIVDKFDTTYNALATVDSRDYTVNYYTMDNPNEGDPCRIEIMVQLNAGEKIGFSCGKLDIVEIGEPGEGANDVACDTGVDWLTYNGSHWIDADQTGNYTFKFVDDENSGCTFSYNCR